MESGEGYLGQDEVEGMEREREGRGRREGWGRDSEVGAIPETFLVPSV